MGKQFDTVQVITLTCLVYGIPVVSAPFVSQIVCAMFRFGVFTLVSSALQLGVPSYALRLIRRFGLQSVGWFIALAFACLALVHLVAPWKAPLPGAGSGLSVDAAYAFGSVLLLIGMGHLESLLNERGQAKEHQRHLRSDCDAKVQEKARVNHELAQNIARREKLERALAESEAQYRFLFAENPQPMFIVDLRSLRFLAVNNAALRQYGFTADEFMALDAKTLIASESLGAFLEDFSRPCSGVQSRGFWRHRRKDQSLLDVEVTAIDLRYADYPARLFLSTDLSHHRHRELELLEKQKADTIAQMAAGAAHHFNNILTVIEGYTSLLLRRSQDPKSNEQLSRISEAVHRAATLTYQLVAAAGRQMLKTQPLDLNEFIRKLAHTIRDLLGDQIALAASLGVNLPPILADPRLIEHVIVNLILNARHAMSFGGKLTISTSAIRLAEPKTSGNPQARHGHFVCLSIQDTGCGMSSAVQAHLFEPFFTTQDTGKGVGLGLASTHGIVKQHHGWIEVTTEPKVGTEFKIFLPCAAAPAPQTEKTPAAPVAPAKPITVLLVEPQERIRGLARFVLNRHGCHVIEAEDGPTALFLLESNPCVDLLLTDVTLSEDLPATALVEHLRQTNPAVKVIYTSDSAKADSKSSLSPGSHLLAKPYTPDRLLQTLQTCLAA